MDVWCMPPPQSIAPALKSSPPPPKPLQLPPEVYEDLDCFKLNDTLEVYGIISVNPVLSLLGEEKDPTERMATPEEQRAHDPPASLVPRLHMLCPLQHNNPLLPSTPTEDQSAFVSSFLVEMASVKAELLAYLTHVLLGDGLAAEYLILHLISNVMNSLHLVPKKDYVANRLVSGALQLARNTSLFLDETQLEQGHLNTSGNYRTHWGATRARV
ncbi:hypothetical protein J4Q44_G00008810 [Coregonus suidteri]|uniref:Mini-chromosome maintenance complex-binding protein n=1 Tax=Coregonus suidteri TaxID=861788 RepID=A0AAN8MF31_9TELE